jgi:hypothetical protein
VAEKADLWLRVRPGGDGALAMSMIHVLLRKTYDETVRRLDQRRFLVRQDNHQLLTARDLAIRRLGNLSLFGTTAATVWRAIALIRLRVRGCVPTLSAPMDSLGRDSCRMPAGF